MPTAEFSIGHLARETGCKIPTIRYYEQVGLLLQPLRSAGNQRRYGPEHVARLAFIRHSRELGFSQTEIRGLLELNDLPEEPCETVTDIARAHLEDINERILRLTGLKSELEQMIQACPNGQIANCSIIESLLSDSRVQRPDD